MTVALFITFLERVLSETTRKIFLIVDRLRPISGVELGPRSIGIGSSYLLHVAPELSTYLTTT